MNFLKSIQFRCEFISCVLFFSFVIHSIAQPQIDASISPSIGDSWQTEYLEAPAFDPGPAGANVVWNFSDLISQLSLEYKIIEPNQAPASDSFPGADFVWELSGFEQFNFYQNESDGITLLGGVNGSQGNINFLTKYIDLEDAFRFPITYETSYSYYSSFRNYLFGNFLNEADRNGQVTADAYGTLTTPFGTYDDVLRIKIESVSFGDSSTVYSWWDVNEFTPILQYEKSSDVDETPYVVYTKKVISSTATQQTRLAESFTIFSNDNKLFIKFQNKESFTKTNVQCFDINGKLIFTEELVRVASPVTPIPLTVNLDQISSGRYFIHLRADDLEATASFIHH